MVVELVAGDPEVLAGALDRMVASQSGWVTLLPGIPEGMDPPPRTVLSRIFSALGPWVPVCTWVAPQPKDNPPHAEIGVLHAAGPKAARTLADRGHPVPDRWVVLADHSRRGLVVAVPPDVAPVEAVRWLMGAGALLCPVPLTGSWKAELHEP